VGSRGGKFVVAFDPLDGSRNIDAGIPTGQSACRCCKVQVSSYASRFYMLFRVSHGSGPLSLPMQRRGTGLFGVSFFG
jgi:hypothetical protein